ncbi:hypothetical protein PssvBMR4_gp62 [Pseudomonas phage MR4]|uniref:Uncharacterized protein n=1 Tax=Pseudomonas phage MR4 TaxID=2711171 RepID=A0A6M3TCL3_9CAUD|nr:hypothetical protein PssvBMR4_gp62 [Pseudomonas phage MR4]
MSYLTLFFKISLQWPKYAPIVSTSRRSSDAK